MKQYFEVFDRTETNTGIAAINEGFPSLGFVWGMLMPLDGLQKIDLKQINAPVTHRLIIRYQLDIAITDKLWLVYDSRRFDVKNFRIIDERNCFYELMVEETEVIP